VFVKIGSASDGTRVRVRQARRLALESQKATT
jgi:hypothetical protein